MVSISTNTSCAAVIPSTTTTVLSSHNGVQILSGDHTCVEVELLMTHIIRLRFPTHGTSTKSSDYEQSDNILDSSFQVTQ